jgi:hypothetical protein
MIKHLVKGITVRGNNHPVPLIHGWELTEKEKKNFDYLKNIDEEFTGFRYKGNVYSLDEFMRLDTNNVFYGIFDSYISDTFFSGVGIVLDNTGESVKAYTYFS